MMPLALAHSRSDEEIVEQTSDIARLALRYIGTGYEVPDDHKFYDSEDPRSHKAWEFACELQEELFATDPNDALPNLPEPEPVPTKRYIVQPYQADHGATAVLVDTLRDSLVMARSLANHPSQVAELEALADTMNAAEEEGA